MAVKFFRVPMIKRKLTKQNFFVKFYFVEILVEIFLEKFFRLNFILLKFFMFYINHNAQKNLFNEHYTYTPGPSHVHVTVSTLFGYRIHTGCIGTPG